jgi:hypothetical protein
MRLLRAIATLDPASGGPAATLGPISKELESSGHTVEIVCFDNPTDPWLKELFLLCIALTARAVPIRN